MRGRRREGGRGRGVILSHVVVVSTFIRARPTCMACRGGRSSS